MVAIGAERKGRLKQVICLRAGRGESRGLYLERGRGRGAAVSMSVSLVVFMGLQIPRECL